MRILCLSNGHGEDAIAVHILSAIQVQNPEINLAALPIVGTGHAYQKLDIPIIGRTQQMPSGGFVYMDNRQLMRDLKGGLLQLTWQQYKAVKRWAKQREEASLILAVGDIVPLIFSRLSGCDYAFIGTAKSEYYLRDRQGNWLPKTSALEKWFGSVYLPWERWLLSRKKCVAVYPRDRLTTDILKTYKIPAVNLGNPMMDGLEPPPNLSQMEKESLTFILLPGSRPPEALENWQKILRAVQLLVEKYQAVNFIAAIAPSLDPTEFLTFLPPLGWQATNSKPPELTFGDSEAQVFQQRKARLAFTQYHYAESLHAADFAIAMAGTATEQFVGLGKPALTIMGTGPQFTPAFAEAQTRLLGESVVLCPSPSAVPEKVDFLLSHPDLLQAIATNGRERMGTAGAAQRIAAHLLRWFC
ncbi:lipid-A-disaccharide synthase-related protein [Picosynechococcus sp. NKBG15041c]|uniref:lipid-A-disaccharide synthase-related protein n=1 Tax=Picosynechococcus sp. NKBG15041c TaxID=1407650 RepID=UPI0003FD00DA|nr:lipid-A-disaccharide synthase-related protein [Picosynechococcus sp. NKBG15041c]